MPNLQQPLCLTAEGFGRTGWCCGCGAICEGAAFQTKKSTKEWTDKIQDGLDRLFPELPKLQCDLRYMEATCSEVADTLLALWPPDEDTDAIHMLSVAGALAIELREDLKDFWHEHPNVDTTTHWLAIEEYLDRLFEMFNADLSEDYMYAERVPEAIEKLKVCIWPAEATKKELPLRLYLVNDTYWVAAIDKSHAKELVEQQRGCPIESAESIQPTEVFEGGSTGAELLASADGKPGIIAMTHDKVE